jgi:hypothetical protein
VSANVEFLKKALLDGLSALERLEEERGLVPEEVRKGLVISVATHPNDTILSGLAPPESNFPGGHPSWYCSCRSTLNCGVLIGSWLL